MYKEDNFLRDENDLISSVDEIIASATKRCEQSDNSSSPDAESLAEGKDEPPRYQVEKEL